jgi:hypothetical protein
MTQPVTIDHDNRRITFQIGKTIPPVEARSNYHRLLDLALDALAMDVVIVPIGTAETPEQQVKHFKMLTASSKVSET